MTLLQADVVSLCMMTGIPPECLWPPQSMLLNLHELFVLCVKCVKKNAPVLGSSAHLGSSGLSGDMVGADATTVPLPEVFCSLASSSPISCLTARYGGRATIPGAVNPLEVLTVSLAPAALLDVARAEDEEVDYQYLAVFDEEEAAEGDRAAATRDRARYDSLMSGEEDDYDIIERSVYH